MGGSPEEPATLAAQTVERPTYTPRRGGGRGKRGFPLGTALIAGGVVIASIVALFLFSGAEVTVTATENQTTVSGEFLATAPGGDLSFEVITVEKTATVSVPSEGTENVQQSAQGSITIENKQDVPQQLIKNTRFETPDGLIFRIRDSVTVPAASNGTPGSLSVTAYADAAGDAYNVGATTFTLPGLKGGDLYTKVTARSTEAMKGGFSGPRPTVKQATRDSKASELRTTLAPEAQKALLAAVPEGYVLVSGANTVRYESQPDTAGATGGVDIAERAIATAVVFRSSELAAAIARQVVGVYAGQPVVLTDTSKLTLTTVGDLPQAGATEFAFSLSGNTTILWQVETEKIASAVAGKSRSGAETILTGFPEVSKASLVLRPFWNTSFPSDPAKIKVFVENTASTTTP